MTLIEVLIAISLLSLLSVGMLVAMRIGFNTLDKTDAHLVQNRKVTNVRQIIENEIDGFTFTRANWHPAPNQLEALPFNQFEPATMRFVTSYSLQDAWRGRPQIAELQVIPGDKNLGVRLIVNETPYTGPEQTGLAIEGIEQTPYGPRTHFTPVQAGPHSFVLADKLSYCRFSYLEPRPDPPFRAWRPDWILPTLPLGVRIEMAPLETHPSEIQMSTVTATFHVNRTQSYGYTDGQ
jgi:hypothetical protein